MTGRPSDAGAMTPERPKSTPLAEPASTDTHVQVHGRHRRRGPRPRVFMKHVQGCPRHARDESERTREGLARARSSGRKLGRPKGHDLTSDRPEPRESVRLLTWRRIDDFGAEAEEFCVRRCFDNSRPQEVGP